MGSYDYHQGETRMNCSPNCLVVSKTSEERMKEERVALLDSSMIGDIFWVFAARGGLKSELGFGEDVDFGISKLWIEKECIGSSNAIVPKPGPETPSSSSKTKLKDSENSEGSKIITMKELGVQENSTVDESTEKLTGTSLQIRGKKNLGCSVIGADDKSDGDTEKEKVTRTPSSSSKTGLDAKLKDSVNSEGSKIITRKELGVQENSTVDESTGKLTGTSLKTRGKKKRAWSSRKTGLHAKLKDLVNSEDSKIITRRVQENSTGADGKSDGDTEKGSRWILKLIVDRERDEQALRYYKYLTEYIARIKAEKFTQLPVAKQAPGEPDGFNLSKMWDAFFPLPTSDTLAYIYGMDGTRPPVVKCSSRSLDIRLIVGDSLARELHTLSFILKIPVPISTVELLMRRIVNTMLFVNAPPPLREEHWRVIVLLFLEALAVYRLCALNKHLANTRVAFLKVLDHSQITEKEYKAVRVLMMPFGRAPYF